MRQESGFIELQIENHETALQSNKIFFFFFGEGGGGGGKGVSFWTERSQEMAFSSLS